MKICPQCSKTYGDDTLNFCLEDGSALKRQDGSGAPPPTVMIPDPRTEAGIPAPRTAFQNTEMPTAPQYKTPARKKSRAWIWVLGILIGLGMVCGGGFIAMIALVPVEKESGSKPVVERPNDSDGNIVDSSRKLVKEDRLSEWLSLIHI